MTIRVYKPQEIRSLIPEKGNIRLWAVWEGTDGNHHEECYEYRKAAEPYRPCVGGIVYKTEAHPLLTDEYEEDPEEVLPGTLRFIRLDDLLKLYRYVDHQGNVYTVHWDSYFTSSGFDRFRLLNGFQLNVESKEFDHIIFPRNIDPDEPLEPDEFNTGKETKA